MRSRQALSSVDRQRKFLDALALELSIKNPSDWGNVTIQQVKDYGGNALFASYGDSLFRTLKIVYSDIEWNKEWFKNISVFPNEYWKNAQNQKAFLDELSKRLHLKSYSDWGKVTSEQIREHGGSALLQNFNNSVFKMLQAVYSNVSWKKEWFDNANSQPSGFWKDPQNHRKFLESIAKKFNIVEPRDWGKLSVQDILDNGGRSLFDVHGRYLFQTLQAVFPEIKWKRIWFTREPVPKGHWDIIDNKRKFLDEVAEDIGIKEHSDWGKVTLQQIIDRGGLGLLKIYGESLFKTLVSVYEDISWKREWFHRIPVFAPGYFRNKENTTKFLDSVARRFQVQQWSDWGKVSASDVIEVGGKPLLKMYDYSIRNMLKGVYSDVEWKEEWFERNTERGYWLVRENQRKFLDKFAKRHGIKRPEDWGKATVQLVRQEGGRQLIRIHGESLLSALQKIYSDIQWKREWFPYLPKYEKGHWDSIENQAKFLERIARQYDISQPNEWKRITVSLVRSKGGNSDSQGLLSKYNGSLVEALRKLYPRDNWKQLLEMNIDLQSSRPQKILERFASSWYPDTQILINYRHPDLLHGKSTKKVELDIWIPKYKLAFEYHGVHHFRETFEQDLGHQRFRDDSRRQQCKDLGITLIEIPYWWNNEEDQLLATVLQERPDMRNIIKSKLLEEGKIMEAIPKGNEFKDSEFLMLSTNWNPKKDPTGWFMVEKYDGLRAYWNGKNMFHRSGNLIPVPGWIRKQLPYNTHLDGELWSGRLSFHKCRSNVINSAWNSLKFQVFDTPNSDMRYDNRQALLRNILRESEHISLAPIIRCEGKDHLLRSLEEIISLGGEGLIIRKPDAMYTIGRSEHSLKVKPTYTEKVVVIEVEKVEKNEEGFYKYCHLEVQEYHSAVAFIHLSAVVVEEDIVKNSVVTIGFSGVNIKGIPKFSTVLEHHPDIEWETFHHYSLDYGRPHRHAECMGCQRKFKEKELRVQVKGTAWLKDSLGSDPVYKVFSFCPNESCITNGLENMKLQAVEAPKFNHKVANQVPEVKTYHLGSISVYPQHLSDELYVFKAE